MLGAIAQNFQNFYIKQPPIQTIMKTQIKHIVLLLAAMAGLHVFANVTGMYETRIIWIDKVLHIMAGIAIGMVWLVILQKRDEIQAAKLAHFMAIIGFVLLVAVAWEITEALFWKYLPFYAEKWNLYSPDIKDLLGDIVANLAGGILLGWVAVRKK